MEMTVRQFIDLLEEAAAEGGDDLPIRLATQPTYPLQSYLDNEVRHWRGVLYIKEANQVGGYPSDGVPNNSPYLPKHIFGDPPEDRCENCDSYNVVGTVLLGGGQDRESLCQECLVNEVPQGVAESYQGDLTMQRVMDLRASATADPSVAPPEATGQGDEVSPVPLTPSHTV